MRDQLQQYVCAVGLQLRTWTLVALAVCLAVGVSASRAEADATISGAPPFATGFVITQDTKLVGDVDCTSLLGAVSCIQFAAPDIELDLNGFTVTGQGCSAGSIGIDTNGQAEARIEGPGKVEEFQLGVAVGTALVGSDKSQVERIVVIRNCEGILVQRSNKVEVEDNIVVNNITFGIGVFGNNNNIQENEVHGSEGIDPGIEVCGTGNEIEENSVTTNRVGILLGGSLLCGTAVSTNTTVDENLVLGNRGFGTDIEDLGTNNTVTKKNVCETGTGAAATVCHDSPTPAFDIDHEVERPKNRKKK